jgi:hypothetical protein
MTLFLPDSAILETVRVVKDNTCDNLHLKRKDWEITLLADIVRQR